MLLPFFLPAQDRPVISGASVLDRMASMVLLKVTMYCQIKWKQAAGKLERGSIPPPRSCCASKHSFIDRRKQKKKQTSLTVYNLPRTWSH